MEQTDRTIRSSFVLANLLVSIALSASPALAGQPSPVPLPGTLSLVGIGAAVIGAVVIRSRRK